MYTPDWLASFLFWISPESQWAIWTLLKIFAIIGPLLLGVAYLTLAERKIIGYMQLRLGPNRVGPHGLLQPIADFIKLLAKEIIVPTNSNRYLFFAAPLMALTPALAAWAVIPFGDGLILASIDAGLLYVLAMTSLGVYGIILAGWASNSKYAFLGAMRSAAQVIAYEIAMGFALVGVLMVGGSLNLGDLVEAQRGAEYSPVFHWFWLPLLPLLAVFFISGIAETNRAPFDVAEGESEIVAGFHVDYSGMAFAVFFLAEYANIILISALTATLFFGGWLSPVSASALAAMPAPLATVLADGPHWFLLKTSFFAFVFLWLRATFPRYRYDQIMRLGWKVFLPLTILWISFEAVAIYYKVDPWFNLS